MTRQPPSSDPLSELLRSVPLRGASFARLGGGADDAGPQAPHADGPSIAYHLLDQGSGWATTPGLPPQRLEAGDAVMFPQGGGHVIRGIGTVMLSAFLRCESRPHSPLLAALPRMLHLPAAGRAPWVLPMLNEASAESDRCSAGSSALLERAGQMIFVDAVRRALQALPAGGSGWLAALGDPQLGRVLALLHAAPAEPWTVDELGRRVGLSRSALHERFVAVAGQPPMQYLAQWRMQCGARLLRETGAPVAAIALDVGYDSEAAFSRAFKRATGLPPAAWRRAQRGAAGERLAA